MANKWQLKFRIMVIKVAIDKRNITKDGKFALRLCFASSGKTVRIGLGIFANESDFDRHSFTLYSEDKKLNKEYSRHNAYIQSELTRAKKLLLNLQLEGKDNMSPVEFRDLFLKKPEKKEEVSFTSYFQSFIEGKSGRTAEIYTATLNKIDKFSHSNDLKFDDITVSWLESFDRYMKSEEIKNHIY